MEKWSVHEDDRPYIRPGRSFTHWYAVAAIGLAAWLGALYFRYLARSSASSPPPAGRGAGTGSARAGAEPDRHPLAATPAPEGSLPTLENSDSLMRDSVSRLIGGKAFADFVVPYQLVRRIVATVDNLPRGTAPTRTMPINAVPGAFAAVAHADYTVTDSANYARYVPYVRVLEALDAHTLIAGYAHTYALFQRAYEELGFPGRYFNDRLMEALDDLLAAPELAEPSKLLRPRVLYEFADPDLETRSAGQKILLRMGPENAAPSEGQDRRDPPRADRRQQTPLNSGTEPERDRGRSPKKIGLRPQFVLAQVRSAQSPRRVARCRRRTGRPAARRAAGRGGLCRRAASRTGRRAWSRRG